MYQLQLEGHGTTQPTSQWGHFLESASRYLVHALQEVRNVQRTSLSPPKITTQSSETTPSHVQEKLETLPQRYQKGLIRDEEFHKKQKQIVQRSSLHDQVSFKSSRLSLQLFVRLLAHEKTLAEFVLSYWSMLREMERFDDPVAQPVQQSLLSE